VTALVGADDRIRAAERRVYDQVGAQPCERRVTVDACTSRVDIRLTQFGPDGSNQPPVLLLHGIASASVLAAPLVPYLRDRRVIVVDWPGHGLSGRCILPRGTDIRRHAVTTLTSLLDALAIRCADVVGHSLGAQFALYAGLELGTRIRRIALLGAPGAAFLGTRPNPMMVLLATPGLGQALLSIRQTEKRFLRTSEMALGAGALKSAPDGLLEAASLLAVRSSGPASVASFFRALIKRRSVRTSVCITAPELSRLTQPTLAVWGDNDVFLAPAAAAASLVAIRDCHLIRLANRGHAPWLPSADPVGRALAAHLDGGRP
jgi:pimeloyl-ACP methyl ester carboxylesterase